MSPLEIGLVILVALLALFATGMPIAFALGAVSVGTLVLTNLDFSTVDDGNKRAGHASPTAEPRARTLAMGMVRSYLCRALWRISPISQL